MNPLFLNKYLRFLIVEKLQCFHEIQDFQHQINLLALVLNQILFQLVIIQTMQESKISHLKATQYAIISWIQLFQPTSHIESLLDLADGEILLLILSQLPKFKLTQEIIIDREENTKVHYRIRNMRILYDSLKSFYQTKLLKDTSKFNVSLGQLSLGNTRQIIKFVQIIIGAIIWSEGKKVFLQKILQLPLQCQQVFMVIIKNAMNYSEDYDENFNSPMKAKNLLQKIEELEQQNLNLNKTIQDLKVQMEQKTFQYQGFKRQNQSIKQQNRMLLQQIEGIKSPEKTDRTNINKLEFSILQQKLNIQKSNYQIKIKQLEHLLIENQQKMYQVTENRASIKEITQRNQILNQNLQSIQNQLDKSLSLLKEKDDLIIKLRRRMQDYQARILKLQAQLETAIFKESEPSFQRSICRVQNIPLSSNRDATSLREQMNSILQELTMENSRLISQKAQKEQQYQEIILNQRNQIRILKGRQDQSMKRKKYKADIFNRLRDENNKTFVNIDVPKLVEGLNSGHHQQIQVLIKLLEDKSREVNSLQQQIRKQRQQTERRRAQLRRRATAINTIRI